MKRVDAAVTVGGRLFHAVAVATENARSPSDDLPVAGTTSADEVGTGQRRRKEVWDGEGKTTGGLGTGVPQRGPGAEPRWGVWRTKSPRS